MGWEIEILEDEDEVLGQGFRKGLSQTGEDEVQGQGRRGYMLDPMGSDDDTEGMLWKKSLRPEGADDTEGQMPFRYGLAPTEGEDAEGVAFTLPKGDLTGEEVTFSDGSGSKVRVRFVGQVDDDTLGNKRGWAC